MQDRDHRPQPCDDSALSCESTPDGIFGKDTDLFRDLLPLLNSGRIVLPRNDRLINQLTGLERRTARSGKDLIDHGPGGHDDLANAVAGAADCIAHALYHAPVPPVMGRWSRCRADKPSRLEAEMAGQVPPCVIDFSKLQPKGTLDGR